MFDVLDALVKGIVLNCVDDSVLLLDEAEVYKVLSELDPLQGLVVVDIDLSEEVDQVPHQHRLVFTWNLF